MKNTLVFLAANVSLKPTEVRLLEKIDSLGLVPPGGNSGNSEYRENPFSGAKEFLTPLACALHDFIIGAYRQGLVGKTVPVSIWDRARYLFLKLWPDAYYNLID